MDCLRNRWADATWPTAAIAGIIGTVSLALLFLTVPRLFFDYVLSPMVKDAYILPEQRYRIFDTVLVAWCIDGLIAAALFFRRTAIRPRLRPWARRTMFLYLVGLAILIVGVVSGTWLRSHGF
jgi:O-antigen ligase